MRIRLIFAPVWFAIGVFSASLGDIAGVLSFPLTWNSQTIPYKTSATCVANIPSSAWIVGGKAIGVNNDISNMAQKMQFTTTDYNWEIKNQIMQISGSFPGQYLDSPGIFCPGGKGLYGTFNNSLHKFCYLGANDGSNNNPRYGCCTIDNPNDTRIRCRNLYQLGECPSLFDSCLINDKAKNRGIVIGGTSGDTSHKNILCFNMSSETFTTQVNSVNALDAELNTYDSYCEYGNLAIGAYAAGCDLMRGDPSHSIIVVGGRNIDSGHEGKHLNTIQVCKNDRQDCQTLANLVLPSPMKNVRVWSLSKCLFLIAGGEGPLGTNTNISVGDICEQQWLHTESMPAPLEEFSFVTGIDSLCMYGGIKSDGYSLQNVAYCTSYYPDAMTSTASDTKTMPLETIIEVTAILSAVLILTAVISCCCCKNKGAFSKLCSTCGKTPSTGPKRMAKDNEMLNYNIQSEQAVLLESV